MNTEKPAETGQSDTPPPPTPNYNHTVAKIDELEYVNWTDEQIQAHFRPAFVETALSRGFEEAAARAAEKARVKVAGRAVKEEAERVKAGAKAAKAAELDRVDPVVAAACVVCGKPVRASKAATDGSGGHKVCRKAQLVRAAVATTENKYIKDVV